MELLAGLGEVQQGDSGAPSCAWGGPARGHTVLAVTKDPFSVAFDF